VPGHDQTDFRRQRLTHFGQLGAFILLALAIGGGPSLGQETPVAQWKGDEARSIELRADQVQTWTEGSFLWVLLEDQAEIRQGNVSLRSDRAVARIERAGRSGGSIHRVDLYLEGSVHDPADSGRVYRDVRTSLISRDKYGLEARTSGGRHHLTGRPQGLPLLARAFPESRLDKRPAAIAQPEIKTSLPSTPIETSANLAAENPPLPAPSTTDPPRSSETTAVLGSDLLPFGSSAEAPSTEPTSGKVDPAVKPAQTPSTDPTLPGSAPGFPDDFSARPVVDPVPPGDPTPMAPNSVPLGPSSLPPISDGPPTQLRPLPDAAPVAPPGLDPLAPAAPVLTDSQRITDIIPRGLGAIDFETLKEQPDGTQIFVIRNGVNVQMRSKEQGVVDIEADNVVIWRRKEGRTGPPRVDFNGQFVDNNSDPLELYLEGHVILRQDQLLYQGKSDQRTYQGERIYFDVRRGQLLALNAQVELFAPGLVTPMKIKSPRILQYHPQVLGPDGKPGYSTLTAMQAEQTVTTGSRFAKPGYRFTSKSIDVSQVVDTQAVPDPGKTPFDKDDLTWLIDARQNLFYVGPVPVFYLPKFKVEADDLNPPLQGVSFATNNFFGQQFRTDYDIFNLINQRHPPEIDVWNLDVDYLSARDKKFGQGVALGSEIGWYGADLINDIDDPWHKKKGTPPSRLNSYAGYFDAYGLFDGSR